MRCYNIILIFTIYLIVIYLTGNPVFAQSVIYVDDDAPAGGNGSSWDNAYKYLQDALADANATDWTGEIRVAQGIYKPDRGAGITRYNRKATLGCVNGVSLYGGFAGIGADVPNERDIEAYKTILSGDLIGDDIEVTDPCDLRLEPTRSDNSYEIVTAIDVNSNTSFDGFVIMGAVEYAGMYTRASDLLISNCTFVSNYLAGMENNSSYLQINNCTFISNSGFGMWNTHCYVQINNCSFIGNYGGSGIWNDGGGMLTSITAHLLGIMQVVGVEDWIIKIAALVS